MSAESDSPTATYPMRVVTRMTGLSPERLRAWETRHRAVMPLRTDGGSRRYTETDVERLLLLRKATEAGHRIGGRALQEAGDQRGLRGPCPGIRGSDVLIGADLPQCLPIIEIEDADPRDVILALTNRAVARRTSPLIPVSRHQ